MIMDIGKHFFCTVEDCTLYSLFHTYILNSMYSSTYVLPTVTYVDTWHGILGLYFNKVFCSMLFTGPSTGGILFSGFKNPCKRICDTRCNLSLLMYSILSNGKPEQIDSGSNQILFSETSPKNPVQELHQASFYEYHTPISGPVAMSSVDMYST